MTERDLIAALHRLGLVRDRLGAALSYATGLKATELEALEHLEEDGPLTQRQLADRLFLTSGGTTLLVDRLEQAGLVTRRPHPTDRRAVLLELNQGAAERASAPLAGYHAALTVAARRLSAPERGTAASFLEAAASAADEAAEALRAESGTRRPERRGPRRPSRIAQR
jgi:DNA-binding MarR family transcriptional regulator